MELKVAQSDLIAPLTKAADLLSGRTGAAFLRTFWLQVKDGKLSVLATDGHIEFRGEVPGHFDGDFLIGLNGRNFYDLAKRLTGTLTLTPGKQPEDEDAGGTVIIKGSGGRFELPGSKTSWFQAYHDFPADSPAILWSGDFLREIIERTTFCCERLSAGTYTECMCMRPGRNNYVEAVGTDMRILASFRFRNDDVYEMLPENGILIHYKHLVTLSRWLPADTIEVALNDKRLHIRTGEGAENYSAPLSSYGYANTDVLFQKAAKEEAGVMKVDKTALKGALETVHMFTSKELLSVNMHFSPDSLALVTKGRGTGSQNVPVEYDGTLASSHYHCAGLLDVLGHFNSESLTFKLTPTPLALISGADDPDYQVATVGMQIEEQTEYGEEVAA